MKISIEIIVDRKNCHKGDLQYNVKSEENVLNIKNFYNYFLKIWFSFSDSRGDGYEDWFAEGRQHKRPDHDHWKEGERGESKGHVGSHPIRDGQFRFEISWITVVMQSDPTVGLVWVRGWMISNNRTLSRHLSSLFVRSISPDRFSFLESSLVRAVLDLW